MKAQILLGHSSAEFLNRLAERTDMVDVDAAAMLARVAPAQLLRWSSMKRARVIAFEHSQLGLRFPRWQSRLEVVDVKESFGLMQFQYRLSRVTDDIKERVLALVQQAGNASASLCEKCGAPARLANPGGWYVVLCELHLAERSAQGEQP